jgi:ABC-type Fe3+ transport system permease subunit
MSDATRRQLDLARLAPPLALGVLPILHLVAIAFGGEAGSARSAWQLDERTVGLLARTLAIAAGGALGALALGLCIGIPLARVRFAGRNALALLLFAAFAVSPYWMALGWIRGDLGSGAAEWLVGSATAVAWVLACAHAPAFALLAWLAVRSVPIGWEEAGLLAAPLSRVLRRIVAPQILALLAAALLLVFALCFTDYAVASLLQVVTYPVELFLLYAGVFEPTQAARACMPLLAVAVALAALLGTLLGRGLTRRWPAAVVGSWPLTRAHRRSLLLLALAAWIACTAWPVVGLVSQLEATPRSVDALRAGWPSLRNSLSISVLSLLLALGLGAAASGPLVRAGTALRCLLATLLLLPVCVPSPAYAIAWVELVSAWAPGLRGVLASLPALVPALCIAGCWAGPVALIVAAARIALPKNALDAARIQEGRALRRFLRVELPLVAPAALVGAAFVTALAQSATGILVLTAPPGFEVAPLRIDNLLHYGAREQAVALAIGSAVLASGLPLALVGAARAVSRRLT